MALQHLTAQAIIDPLLEGHFARLAVNELITQNHDHDFYEFFLVAKGTIWHIINGEAVPLEAGALVFIRAADQHYYQRDQHRECQIINWAFLAPTFHSVLDYLGREAWTARLLTPIQAPTLQLSLSDQQALTLRFDALQSLPRTAKTHLRLALRRLLVELCAYYFDLPAAAPLTPLWLTALCQTMTLPENFSVGRERLMALAQRSPEHVGRAFQKHLGVTPSEYINTLRLNYAANLLAHTDRAVLDIALAVGFDNISHFNHLFKALFQATPRQFRQQYSRRPIP